MSDLVLDNEQLAKELEEAFHRATADFPGGSLDLPYGLSGHAVGVVFDSMRSIAKGENLISFEGVGAKLGGDFKVKQMYQLAINQWVADKHPGVAPLPHIQSTLSFQKEKVLKKMLQAQAAPVAAPPPASGPKKSALSGLNATVLPPRPDESAPAPKAAAPTPAPATRASAPVAQKPAEPTPAPVVAAAAAVAAASAPAQPVAPAPVPVAPAPVPVAPVAPAPPPPPPPQVSADGLPIVSNGIKRMPPPPPVQPSPEVRRAAEVKRIMDETGFDPKTSLEKVDQQLDQTMAGVDEKILEAAKNAEEGLAASAPNAYPPSEASKTPSERGMMAASKFKADRASITSEGFIIENGGPQIGPEENQPETLEEKYIRLGFPPRPPLWPAVMAWPMHSDVQILDQANLKGDELKKMFDVIRSRSTALMARAEQINKYINESYNPAAFGGKPADFRDPHLKATQNDPFRGVYWASLLDPVATQSTQNLVASWSHNEAKTMDGGYVRVSEDQIFLGRTIVSRTLKAPTEQAIELALREGQARGWPSFKCTGNPEFAAIVAKKAKELGMRAEIDVLTWPKKKIIVAATPPKAPTPPEMLSDKSAGADPKAKEAVVEAETPEGQDEKDPFKQPASGKQPKAITDDPTQSAF